MDILNKLVTILNFGWTLETIDLFDDQLSILDDLAFCILETLLCNILLIYSRSISILLRDFHLLSLNLFFL